MGQTDIERDDTAALRAPLRIGVGESPPAFEIAVWTAGETFATAEPTEALLTFAVDCLKGEGLKPTGDVVLVRHQPGDRGLPAVGRTGQGFAIDITDARRTLDGGLLLFVDDTGRVAGWRAERGAMTIWSGVDPELTELAPGAPERLTLVGRAEHAQAR